MRRTTSAVLAAVTSAVVSAVLTACGSSGPPAPPEITETAPAPTPAPPTVAGPPPTLEATTASWTMPDLVGAGLQEAQNAIQELTDFEIAITTSHDATGEKRMQVSDRNWKVCTQSVPPGATITASTRIDFGAVKLDESC